MIYPLLYALSRVLPTPMRATYRPPLCGPAHPSGIAPVVGYGPPQRTWWVWWRDRLLWEHTVPAH